MTEHTSTPLQSLHFSLIYDRMPRHAFYLDSGDDGLYELCVQKGSANNPAHKFKRIIPLDRVVELHEKLLGIGVFQWEGDYGNTTGAPAQRWSFKAVLKKDVFSVEAKGGSATPPGFDEFVEELYRLDFPRLNSQATPDDRSNGAGRMRTGLPGVIPTSIGDLAAFASESDFGQLGALPQLEHLIGQGQINPAEIEAKLKAEISHLSMEERRNLVDMLTQTGMGTREYWERLFGLE